ncbi:MAG: glycosyltransferase family 2 protein [Porticoccaceae bacterium]
MASLHFVIFAFNRGQFLANCIDSIERCAPQCPVTIFDDNSDDPQTRDVLAALGQRYRILTPQSLSSSNDSKHGGLYTNMEAALSALDDDDLICTLQDDMQLVRPLDDADIQAMARFIDAEPNRCFLHHAFMKGAERDKTTISYDNNGNVYYAERPGSSAGQYYSDIFIAPVKCLRRAGWHFLPREAANEKQARALFAPMAYLANPFAVWLPAATAWRGKRRTWALRRGEKRHRCGFHPVRIMDADQNNQFLCRDAARLPIAEDWLTLKGESLQKPWVYHPLQNSRWLKWLNSAELKLRKC